METVSGQGFPDLRDYGRALWRRRVLILVTPVVAVCASLALSTLQPKTYEATAQLTVQSSSAIGSSQPSTVDPARNVETETAVLNSDIVKTAARKSLGHSFDVSISSTATSDVVNVSARSTNARRAAADANGYANAYLAVKQAQDVADVTSASAEIQAKITGIDKSIAGLPSTSPTVVAAQQRLVPLQQDLDQLQLSTETGRPGQAQIVAPAATPTAPASPKPLRNAGIAFTLGLLLGVCLAFIREYFDDSIQSRSDLERATDGLPVLGEVPRVREWRDPVSPYVVTLDAPLTPAAESFRTLRTSMQFIAVDKEFCTLQVTSAQAGDGKTTTIVNLAVAYARAGRQVLIVCCDLRRPRAHEFFGLSNRVFGLTSVFLHELSLDEALQPVRQEPNLFVLAAGPPPPNPSELLSSARARELIACVSKSFDLVLIDTPPVLPVSDALIVSGMVDATLLVASEKSSSRRAVKRAVQKLRQVHAPLVGTVLNNAEPQESYSGYGYGYSDLGTDGKMIRPNH
jgi:capsular exopolysaccharide synthesis family protein